MDDCALCILFWYKNCLGCPVAAGVGGGLCIETPHGQATLAWRTYHYAKVHGDQKLEPLVEAWREIAKVEIDFLRRLLPAKKAKENVSTCKKSAKSVH